MEELLKSIFISCVILKVSHTQSSSTNTIFIRELFYNDSSGTFTSSFLAKTNVHTMDQCFLHCFATHDCISLLYRGNTAECFAFSGLLNDAPLTKPATMTNSYFIEASVLCSQMGYNYEKTIPFCYKIHYEIVTYQEAHGNCSAEGGRLIRIDTATKQMVVETIYLDVSIPKYRIDGQQVNGVWKFSSGSVIPHLYWHEGEPSNNRACLTLSAKHGNKWNDVNCDNYMGYICERLL